MSARMHLSVIDSDRRMLNRLFGELRRALTLFVRKLIWTVIGMALLVLLAVIALAALDGAQGLSM